MDIVFPVIHGRFGEDGGIQVKYWIISSSIADAHIIFIYEVIYYFSLLKVRLDKVLDDIYSYTYCLMQELLEKYNIPFVGTGSKECRQAFDKVKEETFFSIL